MTWEFIAKCLGSLLLVVASYAYLSDKSYTQEKIHDLEKRVDELHTEIKTTKK